MKDRSMRMDDSMMVLMCIIMFSCALILIITVGAVVYMVVRTLMKRSKVEDRPLMILKERYAMGEINDEEFEHKQIFLRK
ncbi:hypothetical protein BK120_23590 [Paenibacillus sp. FSL A5-0031]|uniref:SHOCT domain-containing protein n=1 Tax=Paenibacillus sp. FSL A5-0031 TaxID=1920420 RepID=UPI00096F7314|nr:SHOCT domain-containing protein [Paenibacillus sp. FSL A5-0031]OME78718.1 hypothetical protein BK120_23590 [Paenibacillus sp. FSL A5-0031]